MLELSVAAVVIAAVVWDAFRRYLAVVKWNEVVLGKIKALANRSDERHEELSEQLDSAEVTHANDLNHTLKRIVELEKKVTQTATDLGAISITDMNRRGR